MCEHVDGSHSRHGNCVATKQDTYDTHKHVFIFE